VTGFIIRRLGQAIIVTLGVTMITFGLLHALPGSLARDILGSRATGQALAEKRRTGRRQGEEGGYKKKENIRERKKKLKKRKTGREEEEITVGENKTKRGRE